MNNKQISNKDENGVYKCLKVLINIVTKRYYIKFVKVYNKITYFTNFNKRKRNDIL